MYKESKPIKTTGTQNICKNENIKDYLGFATSIIYKNILMSVPLLIQLATRYEYWEDGKKGHGGREYRNTKSSSSIAENQQIMFKVF